MITLSSVSPVAGATNVPTGTSVSFNLTSDIPILKSSISASIQSTDVIKSQNFVDGVINNTMGTGVSIASTGWIVTTESLFYAGDVGKTVTISGASNPANNGTWTISAYSSANSVQLSGGVFVNETSSFAWFLNNSSILSNSGSYTFTNADVNRFILVSDSLYPANNVEVLILEVLSASRVRTSLSFTGGVSPETNLQWTLYGFVNGYSGTYTPVGLTDWSISVTQPSDLASLTNISVVVTASAQLGTNLSPLTSGSVTAGTSDFTYGGIAHSFATSDIGRFVTILNDTTSNIGTSAITAVPVLGTTVTLGRTAFSPQVVPTINWILSEINTTSSYSFTTGARPKVHSASSSIADPFGRIIRVYFSTPMTSTPDIINISAYTISSSDPLPPIIPPILSVTQEPVLNPTYVDLVLSQPLKNGAAYRVTVNKFGSFNIYGINPPLNRLDVAPNNYADFIGFGVSTSYSVYKDTKVNTPIIQGPSTISFAPVKATLYYNPPLASGSLNFISRVAGTYGNNTTIWLQDPGIINTSLSVNVSGQNILVTLGTNNVGSITTTVGDIINVLSTQTVLVDVVGSGDLSSAVIPMVGATALSGGAPYESSATITFVKNDTSDPTQGSLDVDVVSIMLGTSSSGVVNISNFINNGDGSGSFTAFFDHSLTTYKLSVIAIDNVDNISDESNVLTITVLPESIPGTELTILPYKGVYSSVCDRLLDDIPQSQFFLKEDETIPYTYDPFPFTLTVVDIGVPIYITVTRDTISGKPETILNTIIPQSLTEIVNLQLGRGRNYIFATDGVRTAQVLVAATTYASVLCSVSTEIFNYSRLELDEVNNSIYSDLSTRLAEPYLGMYSVLPSVRPQQTLSMKLAIRSYVSTPGQQYAVQDLTTALTLQSPAIVKNLSERTYFEPAVFPLFNGAESFGGSDLNVWLHNVCAARWSAFVKYLNNIPEAFRLLSADDSEVVFIDDTNTVQRHSFNLLDPECSTLDLGSRCFDNIVMRVKATVQSHINICAASYPMDLCFGSQYFLGPRGIFDLGVPWDLGLLFDTFMYDESYLDPGTDGWAGFCVTPHWDSPVPIGSLIPKHWDPILGDVIRDSTGTKIYGINTNFTNYLRSGDVVYLRNENQPLTISNVNSNNELTLAPPVVAVSAPVQSGTTATISNTSTPDEYTISGLGTLDGSVLKIGTPITLFGPSIGTPILAFITNYVPPAIGACTIQTVTLMPPSPPPSSIPNVYWVIGKPASLKKQGGVALDSMYETFNNRMVGSVYILDTTMAPQMPSGAEVPFYVQGIDTHFLSLLEVGYTIYFDDSPSVTYEILSIDSDTRMRVVKKSPVNTVSPLNVVPPHGKVVPVHSGSNDASITVINSTLASFTAPSSIFTVPSIGKYVYIPDRNGFGSSLNTVGNVLTISSANFTAADVGKYVSISGAIAPANNGSFQITAYISPTQVSLSAVSVTETSNFLWQIKDSDLSPTNYRLGRITALVGAAPTATVEVVTLDGGSWVTATNTFDWEVLPDPLNVIDYVTPTCVYENGYATRLAALTSADIDLYTKNAANTSILLSMTEDITITNIDPSSAYVEIQNIPAAAGSRPLFLSTDVGNKLILPTIAPNPSGGTYVILSVVSPTKVIVSAGLLTTVPTNGTWSLTNT